MILKQSIYYINLLQNLTKESLVNAATKGKIFKILVWKFGNSARRKYVNGIGSSKAKDFFVNCSVR